MKSVWIALLFAVGLPAHAAPATPNVMKCFAQDSAQDGDTYKKPSRQESFTISFPGEESGGEESKDYVSSTIPGLKVNMTIGFSQKDGKNIGYSLFVMIEDPARKVGVVDLYDMYFIPSAGNPRAVAHSSFRRVYNLGDELLDRFVLDCEVNGKAK